MKKKILSAIVAGIIFVGISLPTLNANATPTTDVETTRSQYEEMNTKINDLNEQIQKIDAQISPLVEKINENQKQIDNLKVEMDNTNKQIDQAKIDISNQEDVLAQRLRAVYKSGGETSYLAVIFSSRNLSDLISNISSAKKVVDLDKQLVDQLNQKKDELNQKVNTLKQQSDQVVSLNNEVVKQKTELESKKAQQQALVDDAKAKRDEFNKTYLVPAEMELIQGLINTANSNNASSAEYTQVASNLGAILLQLKSSEATEAAKAAQQTATTKAKAAAAKEAAIAAEAAKAAASQVTAKTSQSTTSNTSRGVVTNPNVQAVIDEAKKHLGQWYEWGATGPDTFDCSGLTSYCYRVAAGIDIGRTTYDQINAGREVSYSELQPGDLIFPHAGHVAIYIGDGLMIHAPQTGEQIKISTVYKFWRARRIIG